MTPQEFAAKWRRSTLSERSACQQHFLDLCDVLGQRKPAEADPAGEWYTFEKQVETTDDRKGFADVWMRGHFGWEYKGKHKNLKAAYDQLLRYRESLENPPLLVVCDMDRIEVHTNFTGTVKRVHAFSLDEFGQPKNLDILRRVFTDPLSLKPDLRTEALTEQAATDFAALADRLRERHDDPNRVAHFLMKLMFCMFAEDIGLLPERLFSKVLKGARAEPEKLARRLRDLFAAMAAGGDFGADEILRFNGGLFADADVLDLTPDEIGRLLQTNERGWEDVEPSIFGTLFERMLDPAKRSQIGAHYTSRQDIETLVEPVVMAPLRREWQTVRERAEALWEQVQEEAKKRAKSGKAYRKESKPRRELDKLLSDFNHRLTEVTVLDPACGSGNFLYVCLHLLLDLEKQVITEAARFGVTLFPQVRPTQLAGIEINPVAQELAQVVIWIGYLQWMHHNGFAPPRDPVLEPIKNIRRADAILDLTDPEHPSEPEWPPADFIVGNPPFLGGKLLRTNLGDDYVDTVFRVWRDRVRPEADLCVYWFEKARQQIERGRTKRAGLLATQGIRGGANRDTLKRIGETGGIFLAESDRKWVLDGAAVHISTVGFDDGTETGRTLDGQAVAAINANLTATADVTQAQRLTENQDFSFMGDTKGGKFDIDSATASGMLTAPNPHGRPNSDVVVPWTNGMDVTRRTRDMWIIDFGPEMPESAACLFERPFALARELVYPMRQDNKRAVYRERWWLHVEARPAMRDKLARLPRFIATPRVSKHRLFVWMESPTLPDCQLIVVARSDDYTFGVLHARPHEVWTRSQGTQVRERESGFRYTPTTCFETFPFPEPADGQRAAIAEAAAELDRLRCNWLNPPEWTCEEVLEFPGSADGPWGRYVVDASAGGIGTVRYPRLIPKDAEAAGKLKKRTLTNLYNERPTWLALAHRRLDEAVFAAYGWDTTMSDDDLLAALLELNLSRALT